MSTPPQAAWTIAEAIVRDAEPGARLRAAHGREMAGYGVEPVTSGCSARSPSGSRAHGSRIAASSTTPKSIVSEIEQQGYRAYTAEDLERRRWTFAQARPTMA
jgi:hypothetical protein